MKKTFVMYASWKPLFDALPDEDAAKLIRAIYEYQLTGEEPDKNWSVYPTFLMLKGTMDDDTEAYNAKVERMNKNRDMKSDRNQNDISKKSDRSQNEINSVTSVSVSVTDTVTDTVTKTKDKKESYGDLGNVKLTVKEYEKLIDEYGSDTTQKAIEYLDEYIEDKGYKSKSNYLAIRRWVVDTVKEKGSRSSPEKFDLDAYLRERMGDTG